MQNRRKVYKAYMAVRIHADVGMIMPAYDRIDMHARECLLDRAAMTKHNYCMHACNYNELSLQPIDIHWKCLLGLVSKQNNHIYVNAEV